MNESPAKTELLYLIETCDREELASLTSLAIETMPGMEAMFRKVWLVKLACVQVEKKDPPEASLENVMMARY